MKCDPERVPELRARYEGVTTGPYLNPKHWNNVHPRPFGDVEWPEFLALVDHSYDLVWRGLTRKAGPPWSAKKNRHQPRLVEEINS